MSELFGPELSSLDVHPATLVIGVGDTARFIGQDAMSAAFAAAHGQPARYGEPLAAAVRQAFTSAAPEDARPLVSAKIAKVTF